MLGWVLLLIVLCRQSIAPKTVMVRMLGGLCASAGAGFMGGCHKSVCWLAGGGL